MAARTIDTKVWVVIDQYGVLRSGWFSVENAERNQKLYPGSRVEETMLREHDRVWLTVPGRKWTAEVTEDWNV